MNLDLAKEFYFRELDGKAQQDARMGVFVGLLSAVGAAIAFLVKNAWPPATSWYRVSLTLSGVSLVLYVLAVIWVLRATLGFRYEKVPSPDNLLVYWQNLLGYHGVDPSAPGKAAADFEDYLVRHFASAASRNVGDNLARSALYYGAARFLLWVIVLSALAALSLAAAYLVPVLVGKGV